MLRKAIISGLIVVAGLTASTTLTGCSQVMNAIEHSDMQVSLKMTDAIFLDPVAKAKNRTVYVAVNNTSDMQEIDPSILKNLIESKLTAKGYKIVDNPENAGYIIQANILYMDYYRNTGTQEGGVEGALVGATTGAVMGQSRDTSIAAGLIGGMVGEVGGALVGKALKVETYAGVVDIEIREKTDKAVKGKIKTNAKQGSATAIETEQEVNTNWQIYRTKIAATAQQTNIDKNQAAKVITERIATQIAGLF